jgi:hypothetical protein
MWWSALRASSIASGGGSIKRNFVPDILMQVVMTSPDQKNVMIGK